MAYWIGDWCVFWQGLTWLFVLKGHLSQGTSEKNAFCETCAMSAVDCVGHYTYIKLVDPVFHIGYFKHTISILQCICRVVPRKYICLHTADSFPTRPMPVYCWMSQKGVS
ncbi:RNA polymerase Rpb1, domain 1-domain-containing protein [Scleroderma citrinum]